MPLDINPQSAQVVLIGNSKYPEDKTKLNDLPTVSNNVKALFRVLSDKNILGIPSKNIIPLIDETNHSTIALKIKQAAEATLDTLIVYYAGHGLVGMDGNLYLAVGETVVKDYELTALNFETIRKQFKNSNANKKILILDCCYAGRVNQHGMMSDTPGLKTKVNIDGTYALMATGPNREAISPPGDKYTAFTRFLIEILEQGLPNDRGVITLDEIYQYIRNESDGWTRLYLTRESLEELGKKDIPADILKKLESIQNKEFKSLSEFQEKVKEKIGEASAGCYKDLLENHVTTLNLPEPEKLTYRQAGSIRFCYNQAQPPPPPPGYPLSSRVHQEGLWERIEEIVIRAVISAGVTAMGYYRGARHTSWNLEQNWYNPSTEADLQSSITLLQTIDHLLTPLTKQESLDCRLFYLGEETKYKKQMEGQLQPDIRNKILVDDEFFKSGENSIRVIFDAIDGTSNFLRGLPLFSSAVAIFLDNHLRFSAIYDPIHNIVYSAVLEGGDKNPSDRARASIWRVAGGERVPLEKLHGKQEYEASLKKAIGTHLTRNKEYRHELHDFIHPSTRFKITKTTLEHLKIDGIDGTLTEKLNPLLDREYDGHREIVPGIRNALKLPAGTELDQITSKILGYSGISGPSESKLEQLATQFGGIYILNSGLLAMVEVARGALGAFVNNSTNTWDVAAGEVLVRACGGKVTDFNGNSIQYSSGEKISVVAGSPEIHDKVINILTNDK